MRAIDLPNAITLGRLLGSLSFLLGCGLSLGPPWPAVLLILLVLVWTSDAVDGMLARAMKDRSNPAGRILDSATDSYAFVAAFVGLYIAGAVPLTALTVVVASRAILDIVRLVGLATTGAYASSVPLTKVKGFVWAAASCLLYAGHGVHLTWLSGAPVTALLSSAIVAITMLATGSFLSRHRLILCTLIAAAPAPAKMDRPSRHDER